LDPSYIILTFYGNAYGTHITIIPYLLIFTRRSKAKANSG